MRRQQIEKPRERYTHSQPRELLLWMVKSYREEFVGENGLDCNQIATLPARFASQNRRWERPGGHVWVCRSPFPVWRDKSPICRTHFQSSASSGQKREPPPMSWWRFSYEGQGNLRSWALRSRIRLNFEVLHHRGSPAQKRLSCSERTLYGRARIGRVAGVAGALCGEALLTNDRLDCSSGSGSIRNRADSSLRSE
jgi:hypothetical protein